MQILVIDREPLAAQLIASKLGAKGHTVIVEAQKQTALDMIRDQPIDVVMVDPAPLSDARPVVVGIWKCLKGNPAPYIMLLSKTPNQEEAIKAGCNDSIGKPLDSRDLEMKIGNADRMLTLCRKLTTKEDIHSQGGVLGKNAFNQLLLSAIDRSFRYAERSFVAFITIDNLDAIEKAHGTDKAFEIQEKLAKELVFIRRQSDVIGRVGLREYAILLQRPMYESEPMDACGRFAEFLDKYRNKFDDKTSAPDFTLNLVELPMGSLHMTRTVPMAARAVETVAEDFQEG